MSEKLAANDASTAKWYGTASAGIALLVIVLGIDIFKDPSPVRYLAFLAWFGALLLLFRSWAIFSVLKPESKLAVVSVLKWLDSKSKTGEPFAK